MPEYAAQQVIELAYGEVIETRTGRLLRRGGRAYAPGSTRPPRTYHWPSTPGCPTRCWPCPSCFDQTRDVNVATIHGDFNLENILVEPQLGDVSLIDFANARQDHVLHDLLHMETEVLIHILPEVATQLGLDPALVLAELSWRLHRVMANPAREPSPPEHPLLHKLWTILRTIRRAARRYLFDSQRPWRILPGADALSAGRAALPEPERAARAPAAQADRLLGGGAGLPLAAGARPARAAACASGAAGSLAGDLGGWHTADDQRRAHTNGLGEATLATLPVDRVPPGGGLPPGSRMPLERNGRFVGRHRELQPLAAGLQRTDPGVVAPALAIAGMGGLGKTQLAVEFAYRVGRFFSGGVFWLACADEHAVAAEVAACGARGAMNLRPNFGELPQEQQVKLVLTEWGKPIPRLLIFDNCEAADLLAQWLPRERLPRADHQPPPRLGHRGASRRCRSMCCPAPTA